MFAAGPVVTAVDAFEGGVVDGLNAELDPDFDVLVEFGEKVEGLGGDAVGTGADTDGGEGELVEEVEVEGLLGFAEGGGEGLDVGHEFFGTVAAAGEIDGGVHLFFDGLGAESLDGGGAANVAEGAAAGAVGFAVGAAEVEVDGDAVEGGSVAFDHELFIGGEGEFHRSKVSRMPEWVPRI